MKKRALIALFGLVALALGLASCGGDDEGALTVYSGREEEYVAPLFERFEEETGNEVEVRYGDSAELASTILEEGDNSPADIFFSQDAGALGALEKEDLLSELDEDILTLVGPAFRSSAGYWVGTSGRARVIAYDSRELSADDMPNSVLDLTDSRWEGRIGWAPTNGSFQAFVTALRLTEGDGVARKWLEDMDGNDTQAFPDNSAIRDAIASGEIDAGLINHYYVAQAQAEEGGDYPVEVYFPPNGDVGALINVAGAGILASSERQDEARELIDFLLSRESQTEFARELKEYPLVEGVKADARVVPLSEIEQPDVDLSNLEDLQGTLELMQEAGVL